MISVDTAWLRKTKIANAAVKIQGKEVLKYAVDYSDAMFDSTYDPSKSDESKWRNRLAWLYLAKFVSDHNTARIPTEQLGTREINGKSEDRELFCGILMKPETVDRLKQIYDVLCQSDQEFIDNVLSTQYDRRSHKYRQVYDWSENTGGHHRLSKIINKLRKRIGVRC